MIDAGNSYARLRSASKNGERAMGKPSRHACDEERIVIVDGQGDASMTRVQVFGTKSKPQRCWAEESERVDNPSRSARLQRREGNKHDGVDGGSRKKRCGS